MKTEENCLYLLAASLRAGGNILPNDVARSLCQAYNVPEESKMKAMATILQYDDDRLIRLLLEDDGYDVPEVKAPVIQIHVNGNIAPPRGIAEDEVECTSLESAPTIQESIVRQDVVSKKVELQEHIQAAPGVAETQQAESFKRKLQRSQRNAVMIIAQQEEVSPFQYRPARQSGRDLSGINHTVISGGVERQVRAKKGVDRDRLTYAKTFFRASTSKLKVTAAKPSSDMRYSKSNSGHNHSEVTSRFFQDADEPDSVEYEVKSLFRHDEQLQVDAIVGFEGERLVSAP